MFSVPKSAAVLFGVGTPAMQGAVLEAQAGGVDAGLGYLERYVRRTRRGAGGVWRRFCLGRSALLRGRIRPSAAQRRAAA